MIISLSIGILSRLTAVSRFHLQSMKKKCSEKSGWDKEKEVARRDEADQRRDARENERRRRQREREGERGRGVRVEASKVSKIEQKARGGWLLLRGDYRSFRRQTPRLLKRPGSVRPRNSLAFRAAGSLPIRELHSPIGLHAVRDRYNVRNRTEICRIISFIR